MLETEVKENNSSRRFFKFENKWLLEPSLSSVVESSWSATKKLDHWGHEIAMQFRKDIDACKKWLVVL